MADTRVDILQINLHHSKSASVVLTRCMTVRHTRPAIELVQEPWLVRNVIKGLSVTGRVCASGEHVGQRACVVVKGLEATLTQEFSTRDLAVVRIRGKGGVNRGKEFIVASAYCAHKCKSPPEDVRSLTRYCREKGLGLIVGCDANAHNEVWGSTDTNVRGRNSWIIWLRKTVWS